MERNIKIARWHSIEREPRQSPGLYRTRRESCDLARNLYNDTVMRSPQVYRKLEVSKGRRAWRPHEERPTIILEQQLMGRLDGIIGWESETILRNRRNEGRKALLYHSMYWSVPRRCLKPTLLYLEQPMCRGHLCHSTEHFLLQRSEDVLPCEGSWSRTPPLDRYLHRERCIPEYREELRGDENNYLHCGDLTRQSVDIRKVFGMPDGHVRPIWLLTGTGTHVRDGIKKVYWAIRRELSWSEGLKPRPCLADDVLLWKHRKGNLHQRRGEDHRVEDGTDSGRGWRRKINNSGRRYWSGMYVTHVDCVRSKGRG